MTSKLTHKKCRRSLLAASALNMRAALRNDRAAFNVGGGGCRSGGRLRALVVGAVATIAAAIGVAARNGAQKRSSRRRRRRRTKSASPERRRDHGNYGQRLLDCAFVGVRRSSRVRARARATAAVEQKAATTKKLSCAPTIGAAAQAA